MDKKLFNQYLGESKCSVSFYAGKKCETIPYDPKPKPIRFLWLKKIYWRWKYRALFKTFPKAEIRDDGSIYVPDCVIEDWEEIDNIISVIVKHGDSDDQPQ